MRHGLPRSRVRALRATPRHGTGLVDLQSIGFLHGFNWFCMVLNDFKGILMCFTCVLNGYAMIVPCSVAIFWPFGLSPALKRPQGGQVGSSQAACDACWRPPWWSLAAMHVARSLRAHILHDMLAYERHMRGISRGEKPYRSSFLGSARGQTGIAAVLHVRRWAEAE